MSERLPPDVFYEYDENKSAFLRDRIEQLETALQDIVSWADDLGLYAEPNHVLHPVLKNARIVLENKNG